MPNSIRFGRSGASKLLRTTNLPSSGAFTAMCWVRVPTLSGWMCAIQLSGAGVEMHQMGVEGSSGTNAFAVNNSIGTTPGTPLVNGRWYHMTMTSLAGTGSRGYLDGVLDSTPSTEGAFTATNLWIGDSTGGDPMNGNIAAIKIWNRVLSRDEIYGEIPYALPVSRAALNVATPVPQGWERMDNGFFAPDRGNPLTRFDDWSGNGYLWSETGTIDTDIGPPIRWAPKWSPIFYQPGKPAGGTAYTLTMGVGAFTLTGNATALKAARKLTASVGTFTETGNATGLAFGHKIAANVGAFTLTGNTTTLKADRKLAAGVGAFTETGNATGLAYGRTLSLSVGAFTLTGNATALKADRKLTQGTGAFVLTGIDIGLSKSTGNTLAADTGSFTFTGIAANLKVARKLALGVGAFTETGTDTTLRAARMLQGSTGLFTETGVAVALKWAHVLSMGQGAFTLTGNAITFTDSGAVSYVIAGPLSRLSPRFLMGNAQPSFLTQNASPRYPMGRVEVDE